MKLKALAAAALVGAAGCATAATVNIGGLTLDTGPTFSVASIYENVVDKTGDVLAGVGEVTQINGVAVGSLCNGCELTYRFDGYKVTSISSTDITFSGGYVNFYLGSGATNDFNPFGSGSSAADLAAATNGSLFLTLAGHSVDAASNTFAGTGRNIGTASPVGFGAGLADVDLTGMANGNTAGAGAIANGYFNTNGVTASYGGNADLQLGSSFSSLLVPHPAECPSGPLCVAGSADFRGNITSPIPEPGTYALMLAGLGVLGFLARRRRPH